VATKIYVDFGQGGGQAASTVVFGIGRCGSCGDGGVAAPRISMVDGVESKQLREGRCLWAMGGSARGGRVLSSDEAGSEGAEIIMAERM
jgi:hypothetical protein